MTERGRGSRHELLWPVCLPDRVELVHQHAGVVLLGQVFSQGAFPSSCQPAVVQLISICASPPGRCTGASDPRMNRVPRTTAPWQIQDSNLVLPMPRAAGLSNNRLATTMSASGDQIVLPHASRRTGPSIYV